MATVLIVDDEESICWGLARLCEQLDIESETASSAEQGLQLAQQRSFDVVIMDVRLPGLDGISAIDKFHQQLGQVPIITITAFGDLQTAVEAIQKGSFEYIVKPFDLDVAKRVILQAVTASRLLQSPSSEAGENSSAAESKSPELIGSSAIMQEVYKQIALTTTTRSSVLISGESGTGKELVARSIHQFGSGGSTPFVAVNIAALSPSLIESELFGHVKGAFTGADVERVGLIQQANGGTLFLDEVAEIPLAIQVKLLRVLDQGEVMPVGSNSSVKVDFRLISATHQDLLAQVNHGEFRHDLLYRLKALEIQIPPLRERKQDIPELVQHFLRELSPSGYTVSDEYIDGLNSRSWRGNVRELQNVVARSAALARGGVLTPELIPAEDPTSQNGSDQLGSEEEIRQLIQAWTQANWNEDSDALYDKLLEVIDPAILPTAFELSGNQYSAAARRLGIHRTTLKKKLDKFGS